MLQSITGNFPMADKLYVTCPRAVLYRNYALSRIAPLPDAQH